MTTPTVTMHQPPTDNRPPPPETATVFVIVYAWWYAAFCEPHWGVFGISRSTRAEAEKDAEGMRNKGYIVYGIAEITATRQEPSRA